MVGTLKEVLQAAICSFNHWVKDKQNNVRSYEDLRGVLFNKIAQEFGVSREAGLMRGTIKPEALIVEMEGGVVKRIDFLLNGFKTYVNSTEAKELLLKLKQSTNELYYPNFPEKENYEVSKLIQSIQNFKI